MNDKRFTIDTVRSIRPGPEPEFDTEEDVIPLSFPMSDEAQTFTDEEIARALTELVTSMAINERRAYYDADFWITSDIERIKQTVQPLHECAACVALYDQNLAQIRNHLPNPVIVGVVRFMP